MDFLKILPSVVSEFERASVRYALIGGFAMAMRGVQLPRDFRLERADG